MVRDSEETEMPSKGKHGEFAPLPSTLERSSKKAQDTYEETLEHAEQSYQGDDERAHRVAWASVKHSFEKHGDHWEPKDQRGPSDPRSKKGGPNAGGPSYGGVDVEGHTKHDLFAEAKQRDIAVATHMTKAELAEALERDNDRATRNAR
jgi:cation transport regulator ChaB